MKDYPPLTLQRKTSNSAIPALASPRTRLGSGSSGFDGILNGSENAWSGMKRRVSVGHPPGNRLDEAPETQEAPSIKEEEVGSIPSDTSQQSSTATSADVGRTSMSELNTGVEKLSLDSNEAGHKLQPQESNGTVSATVQSDPVPPEKVLWSYIDFQGETQGGWTFSMRFPLAHPVSNRAISGRDDASLV